MHRLSKRTTKKKSSFNFRKKKWDGFKTRRHSESTSLTTSYQQKELHKAAEKTKEWIQEQLTETTPFPQDKVHSGFSLDPWQKEAVDALMEGANVVVDAPTTAGKTRVVESYFSMHLQEATFRACYTCPVKSLSNDKVLEFRQIFGNENVGIATGDIKENLNAPIVVATLETYRNSLLGIEPDLGRSLVVFDEYHFLDDKERGNAWEEAMILTPPHCQMLLLSASVSNGQDIARWIESLNKRKTQFIQTLFRPVPLEHLTYIGGYWISLQFLKHPPKPIPTPINDTKRFQSFAQQIQQLNMLGLTPTIAYAAKRSDCEIFAKAITKSYGPLDTEQAAEILEIFNNAAKKFHANTFLPTRLKHWILSFGVAYHHSGLAPKARLLIEYLLKQGKLKCCTATMGLSLGINFSVRSTFIADRKRPSSAGFQKYSSSEVLQMTGRAGRRGRDKVGFSCWPDLKAYKTLANANRKACAPQLNCDHTTFLGLVSRGYSSGQLENFYRRSFYGYHHDAEQFNLPSKKRWTRILDALVPCKDPGEEYSLFRSQRNALCYDCVLQTKCHRIFQRKHSPLTQLYAYLHTIGALHQGTKLTPFGEAARYFPQFGGLLVANMIVRQEVRPQNFVTIVHLFACLSLSKAKYPKVQSTGKLPANKETLIQDLKTYYPIDVFPELYDTEVGYQDKHGEPQFRELNFNGSGVIELWLKHDGSIEWEEFILTVSSKNFGAGDATGLIYRTASMLQSIIQLGRKDLKESAIYYRNLLLRSPLDLGLPTSEPDHHKQTFE
ncbi:MAG: DEAD/DEAH box helicase [Zetaproteobacteria bacterium]|nr:DEAD/DEAH box helicase [Zetaproteobacteria bacterium]